METRHPLGGGLIVPSLSIDPVFEGWLRQKYGRSLRVGYNRKTHRFGLLTPSLQAGGWVCLMVLETPEGGFMPLGEAAKKLIVDRVQPSADAKKALKAMRQQGKDAKEKESQDFRQMVRDVFWEDRRQAFGIPVVRVPVNITESGRIIH